jgi:hypothetical protein
MSIQHRSSGINNSSSKHTYQFSKSGRFPIAKNYNNTSCYEHKTQFKDAQHSPAAGFQSASKRFGNLGVGKSDIRNWAPHGDGYYKYNFSGTLGKMASHEMRDHKNKTQTYSFGVGRENMKKLYVEEILQNKNNIGRNPGAGQYEAKDGFGGGNDTQYSMRKRLYMDELALNKSKKLPGPGFYQHPDIVSANVADSRVANVSKFTVSKADDRFRVSKFNVPAPGSYQVKNALNENHNSQHSFMGATRIGNDRLTFVDTEWKMKDKK